MSTAPETQDQGVTEETKTPTPSVHERAREAAEGEGITLSDAAAGEVQRILKEGNYPESMYLYVGVKGGGCSGLQYVLDLRDEAHAPVNENDEVFKSQGLAVVCDLKSFIVGNLGGTVIDYQETMMAKGFVFNNPNAKHSCGCGSSYSP